MFLLHPDIETSIRDFTRHTATGSYVDLEPDHLREILDAIRDPLGALGNNVQVPQILTVMEIRSSVRRLVAPSMPRLDHRVIPGAVADHEHPTGRTHLARRLQFATRSQRRWGPAVGLTESARLVGKRDLELGLTTKSKLDSKTNKNATLSKG